MKDRLKEKAATDFVFSEGEWKELALAYKQLHERHDALVLQVPGYRRGDCIYDHFMVWRPEKFYNFTLTISLRGNFSEYDANSSEDPKQYFSYSYVEIKEELRKMDRYQTLLESHPVLRDQELTTLPREHWRDLDRYIDNLVITLAKSHEK